MTVSTLRADHYTHIKLPTTFVTHETFVRSIATPKESNPVQPHPMKSGQVALSL
ncbi:transcriptional regulator [Escherichia coli]|uniref:transcriptional regulator n=1 Tax=Escherichia coli TaxID=562 RepID=UPI0028CB80AA|nr:transcriptional regulator [Escherichia coli]